MSPAAARKKKEAVTPVAETSATGTVVETTFGRYQVRHRTLRRATRVTRSRTVRLLSSIGAGWRDAGQGWLRLGVQGS